VVARWSGGRLGAGPVGRGGRIPPLMAHLGDPGRGRNHAVSDPWTLDTSKKGHRPRDTASDQLL
jgi:hypothetical protein